MPIGANSGKSGGAKVQAYGGCFFFMAKGEPRSRERDKGSRYGS